MVQTIVLQGVDLAGGVTDTDTDTDTAIIQNLLTNGK